MAAGVIAGGSNCRREQLMVGAIGGGSNFRWEQLVVGAIGGGNDLVAGAIGSRNN